MAISLSSISRARRLKAPRVVVYGPQKIGKTTFANSAPRPVFIPTEDGLAGLEADAFPLCRTFQDVLDAVNVLGSEQHDFQSVVIDSLDWLEPMIWGAVVASTKKEGVENIEDFGYGKGYAFAAAQWQVLLDLLNALRDVKNMAVILLAHHEIKRFDSPDSEPYDRYQIKLHKSAGALVQEWADVIGFANHRVLTQKTDVGFNKKVTRGVTTGERLLHVTEKPAFVAGNRFGLPDTLPLRWPDFEAALELAMNPPAAASEPTPATTKE